MIVSTSDEIPGREITETIGLVTANSVRARNVGRDVMSQLKNIRGGEISAYRDLLTESRHEAIERMETAAAEMGADGVVAVRMTTAGVMDGVAEILAYGTAVKLR